MTNIYDVRVAQVVVVAVNCVSRQAVTVGAGN